MAYVIALPCINVKDTACVTVCPFDCIHPTKDEASFQFEEMLYIDPDVCPSCGLCIDECPVKAIFPQDDLPSEWNRFVEQNAAFYKTASREEKYPYRTLRILIRCDERRVRSSRSRPS